MKVGFPLFLRYNKVVKKKRLKGGKISTLPDGRAVNQLRDNPERVVGKNLRNMPSHVVLMAMWAR